MPTLQVIVGPDSFQEHAPRLWREGLATDPIFMDVTAEVLQGSGSYLLLELMDGMFFSIFSAGWYGKAITHRDDGGSVANFVRGIFFSRRLARLRRREKKTPLTKFATERPIVPVCKIETSYCFVT